MLCWQTLLAQLQRADAPTTLWLFYRHELRPLTHVLADDERVLAAALGSAQQRSGIVVATDRRCLLLVDRPQQPVIALVPYAALHSVTWTAEFLYGTLTLRSAQGEQTITHICPGVFAERLAWHIRQRLAVA